MVDDRSVIDQLQVIASKLSELKRVDTQLKVFGAERHQYELRPVASEQELAAFESQFRIVLPVGYRSFLLQLGNGGAGPYYGLEPFKNALFRDLDYRDNTDLIDPSMPFAFESHWNLEFRGDVESQEYSDFEQEYFDNKWANGLIRICNFGCGVSLNLVVNGPEYGNIWVDDRCNDGGLYPDPYFGQKDRTEFLNWYELWLDRSLEEVG
jgi:hypothetical protein